MGTILEFRGEQQAMSSKHTGVEPTGFNAYIKSVVEQEPIVSVELTPEYLEAADDLTGLTSTFGESLVKGMTDRLRSGELAPQEEIDEIHRRLNDIIAKRKSTDRSEYRYVWFTLRRGGSFKIVDWPVANYVGHDRLYIRHLPKVSLSLSRLYKNRTIASVEVVGKLPTHWYQEAL